MFYPTYFCDETKTRHIVRDRYCCECGHTYNLNYEMKKKDFKKIKFKKLEEITCVQCKSAMNMATHTH